MLRALVQRSRPCLPTGATSAWRRSLLTFTPGNRPAADAASSVTAGATSSARPLLVLFGWLGCKPRYLDKYVAWYRSAGLDTLSYIPPMTTTMFPSVAQRQAQEAFDDIVAQASRNTESGGALRPVVFHAFSLNGVNALGQLLRHTELSTSPAAPRLREAIRGYIMDSAPEDNITPELVSRGFTQAFLSLFAKDKKQAIRYEHPVVSPIIRSAARVLLARPAMQHSIRELLHVIYRDLPPAPILLLYSAGDVLIRPEMVEGFANAQRNLGRTVIQQRWTDSEHVMHFRQHPEEYKRAVLRFLDSVDLPVPKMSPIPSAAAVTSAAALGASA